VEKTEPLLIFRDVIEKHLHGRGEDLSTISSISSSVETPPRAWRRLHDRADPHLFVRNTSTGVEKTLF